MYPCVKVKSTEELNIYAVVSYGISSNIYILESEGEKAIIDIGYGPPHSNINEILENLGINIKEVGKILITHRHKDHTRELKRFINENEEAEIYIHRNDRDIVIESLKIDKDRVQTIYGDEEIDIGKIKVKVIHTPGHTSGSVCFKYEENIFTGDLVFTNGLYGRTDLPSGNHKELTKSLEKILRLNVNSILPGHGEIALKDAKNHIKLAWRNAIRELKGKSLNIQ